MSGLEIPGLILGAIGALPPAFHGCMRLYDQVKDCRQFDKILRKFRLRVGVQQSIFTMSTRSLLQGILQDDQLTTLLKDLKNPRWNDPNWSENLRNHLGDEYFGLCTTIFESMREALEEISQIDRDGFQPPENPEELPLRSRLTTFYRKAKFGLRDQKKILKDLLDELRQNNDDLSLLVDRKLKRDIGLSPLTPRKNSEAGSFPTLKLIQDASKDLFEVLSTVRCDCHTTSLRLYTTKANKNSIESLEEISQTEDDNVSNIEFYFALLPKISPVHTSLGYHQFVIQSQKKPYDENFQGLTSSTTLSVSGSIKSDGNCQLSSGEDMRCYFSTTENPAYQHFLKNVTNSTITGTCQTLKRILSRKFSGGQFVELCMRDRLKIAATLALSVLQLHNAPWIQRNWRSRDVFFFSELQTNLDPPPPYLSIPSLPQTQPEEQTTASRSNIHQGGAESPHLSNQQVYGLGLILLELGVGKTLEDSALGRVMVTMSPEKKEYMMAQELIIDLSRNMGADYDYVVRTCLEFGHNAGDTWLEQQKVQEEYFARVINPLNSLVLNFTKRGL